MLVVVLAVSVVILAHLGVVLWLSLFEGTPTDGNISYGLVNYAKVFADPFTWTVIGNTLVFSLATLAVALAFGIPAAWLMERTDIARQDAAVHADDHRAPDPRLRRRDGLAVPAPPAHRAASTSSSARCSVSRRSTSRTYVGMGWVQGLNLAPLAFIMTAAVFRAMDPGAGGGGADVRRRSPRQTWRRITLRLRWPGILAAAIYIFTIGFAAFDVPAIIGWGNRALHLLDLRSGC